MTTYSYRGRIITPFEILFWGGFLGIPTALCIAATFTHQDPPVPLVGWAILFSALLGLYGVAVAFLYRKWKFQKNLRMIVAPPGLVVGWDNDQYCVSGEAVTLEITDCITKMQHEYSRASEALRGCVVWFREPAWVQQVPPGFVARKVAGIQDGQLIVVGWREDLSKSALKHELAHRVLQVCAGDPPEVMAHAQMSKMGLL